MTFWPTPRPPARGDADAVVVHYRGRPASACPTDLADIVALVAADVTCPYCRRYLADAEGRRYMADPDGYAPAWPYCATCGEARAAVGDRAHDCDRCGRLRAIGLVVLGLGPVMAPAPVEAPELDDVRAVQLDALDGVARLLTRPRLVVDVDIDTRAMGAALAEALVTARNRHGIGR